MTRLRHKDLAAFSKALADLHAEDNYESLASRALTCLRALFDTDFVSFSSMDLSRGRLHTTSFSPAVVPDWPGLAVYQRFFAQDPVAAHIMRTRDVSAFKMSDFVNLRQYRDLAVYTEVFAKVGSNRRMGFAVQNAAPTALAATVNRTGRDFTEEERTLLNLLRPHLLLANAKAIAFQHFQVSQAHERVELGDVFGIGLGEVDDTGKLLWLTPKAEKMLAEFFPDIRERAASPGSLPKEVAAKLLPVMRFRSSLPAEDPTRLSRSSWWFKGPAGRKLNVRLVVGSTTRRWQLLFEVNGSMAQTNEMSYVSELTDRERQVLHWVRLSKSNPQIATILEISVRTVTKHVEHLLAKLHVERRTDIVRLFAESGGRKR